MKAFYAILFVLVSFVGSVYGQITNGFPMGADLERYSLAQVRTVEVYLWQGNRVVVKKLVDKSFTTRTSLEAFFQALLQETANRLLTEQHAQDKTAPFTIAAFACQTFWDENNRINDINYFQVTGVQFSLVKTGTNYTLPDLSGVRMELAPLTGQTFNHVLWIGMTASNGDGIIFDADSNTPSPDTTLWEIDLRDGISYAYIAKSLLMDKDVKVQVRTLTRDSAGKLRFQVFENGVEVAPKPLSLTVTKYPPPSPDDTKAKTGPPTPQTLIRVIGGEQGMTVQIQSSTDLVNWSDIPAARFTLSLYGVPSYEETAGGSQSFYRVVLVE